MVISNKYTEEELLMNNGFDCTTLGKRVLRGETAAIYVASIINYVYKGWFYEVNSRFL